MVLEKLRWSHIVDFYNVDQILLSPWVCCAHSSFEPAKGSNKLANV